MYKRQNTHPVITLSLKCAKQGDYREALRGLKYEIQRQFINNKFILASDKLADEYKDEYKKILSRDEDAVWSNSIQLLSICLKPVSYTHLDVYKRQQLARLDVEGRNGFTNKKISIGSAIKIR